MKLLYYFIFIYTILYDGNHNNPWRLHDSCVARTLTIAFASLSSNNATLILVLTQEHVGQVVIRSTVLAVLDIREKCAKVSGMELEYVA